MSLAPRDRLRRRILADRDRLTPEERRRKSRAVLEHLWRMEDFVRARTIFTYVAFRSEVETMALIERCLARGMRVAVPYTRVGEGTIAPYLLADPEHDLRPGFCGIPEPDVHRLAALSPAEIEVTILPGSVFDPSGGRLGYGGGFYDRFLAGGGVSGVSIGLAFELQVVPSVPLLPHDRRVHALVTEKRIIRCSQKPG